MENTRTPPPPFSCVPFARPAFCRFCLLFICEPNNNDNNTKQKPSLWQKFKFRYQPFGRLDALVKVLKINIEVRDGAGVGVDGGGGAVKDQLPFVVYMRTEGWGSFICRKAKMSTDLRPNE